MLERVLSGGGDISANRSLAVDIDSETALGAVADNADTLFIYDDDATTLKKVTRANLVLTETEVDGYVSDNGFAADADVLKKDGSIALTSNWDIGGTNKITNMPAPTAASDAATKSYVDTQDATLITEVGTASGSGLTGGTASGTANLQVVVDDSTVEIATNTIQVKDGGITNAKLASGIDAAKITTGALPTARIDVGTGANQIVQLNGSGELPAVDGSNLTNVTGTDSTKLPLAGGTLTGNLNIDNQQQTSPVRGRW